MQPKEIVEEIVGAFEGVIPKSSWGETSFMIKKFPFKKINTEKTVSKLQLAIDELLSKNTDIHDIKWSTYEEFNII